MYVAELKRNHEWYSVQTMSGNVNIVEMHQRPIAAGKKAAATVHVKSKFKKGEKQTKAAVLYRTHVIAGKMDNSKFIDTLMSELSMSRAGARTYAYNCRKV